MMGFCQMEKTFYIIAGSWSEAYEYVQQKIIDGVELNSPTYIDDESLIQETNPEGVCIGTWKDRENAWSIMGRVYDLTDKDDEPKLLRILAILQDLDNYRKKS